MSDALSALKSGQPKQALQLLQQQVRQRPDDARLRVFLFQLLAVLGQWERAVAQLGVIGELDKEALPMVHVYREAVRGEGVREDVFAGKRAPLLFGAPEPWMALLIEALSRDPEDAACLRAAAMEQAPAIGGSIDGNGGKRFAWLADADPRLGPVVELFANGQYYWVPMCRIATLRSDAPADLRDQVWLPVVLALTNGGELAGLMPVRYPGTTASGDDKLLLAARTDWMAQGDVQYGLGQRVFASDTDDVALLDTRAIAFDPAPDASAPAGDGDA